MAGRKEIVTLCQRLFPDVQGRAPEAFIPKSCTGLVLGGTRHDGLLALDPFRPPEESERGLLGVLGLWGQALGCGPEEALLAALGGRVREVGQVHPQASLVKLVAYVPLPHLTAVREAVTRAGAGAIGGYTNCTFVTTGVGTFRPGPGSTPFIGEEGKLEQVEEARLETVLYSHQTGLVLDALLAAHPYEEPAYDLLPEARGHRAYGAARIATLQDGHTPQDVARKVQDLLGGGEIYLYGETRRVHTLGANFGRMEGALDVDLAVAPLPRPSGATLCVPPWWLDGYAARIFTGQVRRAASELGVPVRGTLKTPWKKMDS